MYIDRSSLTRTHENIFENSRNFKQWRVLGTIRFFDATNLPKSVTCLVKLKGTGFNRQESILITLRADIHRKSISNSNNCLPNYFSVEDLLRNTEVSECSMQRPWLQLWRNSLNQNTLPLFEWMSIHCRHSISRRTANVSHETSHGI